MDSAGNEMLHNPAARHKERHAGAAVWHDGARGGAAALAQPSLSLLSSVPEHSGVANGLHIPELTSPKPRLEFCLCRNGDHRAHIWL